MTWSGVIDPSRGVLPPWLICCFQRVMSAFVNTTLPEDLRWSFACWWQLIHPSSDVPKLPGSAAKL